MAKASSPREIFAPESLTNCGHEMFAIHPAVEIAFREDRIIHVEEVEPVGRARVIIGPVGLNSSRPASGQSP